MLTNIGLRIRIMVKTVKVLLILTHRKIAAPKEELRIRTIILAAITSTRVLSSPQASAQPHMHLTVIPERAIKSTTAKIAITNPQASAQTVEIKMIPEKAIKSTTAKIAIISPQASAQKLDMDIKM